MCSTVLRFVLVAFLLSGCSLINDFGGFAFGEGKADSGPDDGGGGGSGKGGDGKGGSGGTGGNGGAGSGPDDGGPKDAGDAGTDAGTDAQVDSGPPPDPICEAAPCDEYADCNSSTGVAVCTCQRGFYDFHGNGTECIDLNECTAGLYQCDDDATCANKPGGYDCICNPGFVWDASAMDCIDSCLVLLATTCDPSVGICVKPTGEAECRCPAGYMDVNGDGSLCDPDAICMALNCDPLATCDSTAVTPMCICPDGFSGDGTVCLDEDECTDQTDTCDANATCTNTTGGFACACNNGYNGSGQACSDVNECTAGSDECSDNAACINTTGAYDCDCNTGYDGDGRACSDVNECMLGSHDCDPNADCINTVGDFDCDCRNGYDGNGQTCNDVDECTLGTDNCADGVPCVNTPGSFTCGCEQGYRKNAQDVCVDINECVTGEHNCSINATCTNTQGSFACMCNNGYSGPGPTCTDNNECMLGTHDCNANATCMNNAGAFLCPCNTGYTGGGHGPSGCTDVDECTLNTDNCHPDRAVCTNTPAGRFTCTCINGYTGDGVTCSDVNECTSGAHLCDTMPAACVNNTGSYTCMCPGGYTGMGVGANGCADIDECTANTDGCDDTPNACVNSIGSFACMCPMGYTGVGVGTNGCTDINECTANTDNCDDTPNACVNNTGSFSCMCPMGYSGMGIGASGCTDINECTANTDGCDSSPDACVNNTGSFSCMCPMGYSGTGVGASGCTDINECATGAHTCTVAPAGCTSGCAVTACVNNVGGYSCACPPGYSGSGMGAGGCGMCSVEVLNSDVTRPNDARDNDCDGLWDKPIIQLASTVPGPGAATALADLRISILTPAAIPNATLYCRSYRRSGAPPAFALCPNPITNPASSTSSANDGAWRTEFRWVYADRRISLVESYDYYVHSSLHGAPKCPDLAATDAQIIMAADAQLAASQVGTGYTDPGDFRFGSDTFLTLPFVTLGYVPPLGGYFSLRKAALSVTANALYRADMWSLRHRFVSGGNGRYVLMRRAYAGKRLHEAEGAIDCKAARFEVLNSYWARYPPDHPTRPNGYAYYETGYACDAVVVNRAGAGVCVNVSPTTGEITIGPPHNRPGRALGYGASDKFMWQHLLDERGWHGKFKMLPKPESGFRNFSEKCDVLSECAGFELFLPDKTILRP